MLYLHCFRTPPTKSFEEIIRLLSRCMYQPRDALLILSWKKWTRSFSLWAYEAVFLQNTIKWVFGQVIPFHFSNLGTLKFDGITMYWDQAHVKSLRPQKLFPSNDFNHSYKTCNILFDSMSSLKVVGCQFWGVSKWITWCAYREFCIGGVNSTIFRKWHYG